jgi:hypothetical protein
MAAHNHLSGAQRIANQQTRACVQNGGSVRLAETEG